MLKKLSTAGIVLVALLFECAALTAAIAGKYALTATILAITIFVLAVIWAED